MTREETQKLLLTISSLYPNFEVKNKTLTVDSWCWALEDYPAPAVKAALNVYVKTNNTGFAPSVSQLIGCMYEKDHLTEGEAWAMVKNALKDSGYNSKEKFDGLPENVQRAVGGSSMLREWAMMDSDEVNTVIMSNFQRTYKAVLSQKEHDEKVPKQISNLIKGLLEDGKKEKHNQ